MWNGYISVASFFAILGGAEDVLPFFSVVSLVDLTGTPPTEEEMRAPATIKPENATPNIPKPQEPAKEKPDQKKPKPEKKPAKKKEKQSEDSMQLSLEGWF